MDRHVSNVGKFAVLVGVIAVFALLGGCGGGGGGGGGGASPGNRLTARTEPISQAVTDADRRITAQPGEVKVPETSDPDTQDISPRIVNTTAQPGAEQVTLSTDLSAEAPITTHSNASPQQLGIASLAWQPPTQRVDGESLSMSEIAGYRIYYATRSGDYTSALSVDDPYTHAMLIEDLPVGTYYFVMTTVDTNGIESGYSREAVKVVRAAS